MPMPGIGGFCLTDGAVEVFAGAGSFCLILNHSGQDMDWTSRLSHFACFRGVLYVVSQSDLLLPGSPLMV